MAADADDAEVDVWEQTSFTVASLYRTAVVDRLSDGPATPTGIADDVNKKVTHVSRALIELRDEGVVDLLVPDNRKKGRVYGLTEDGREVKYHLDEMGETA